ncbi:DUF2306 domain-containing protein [Stappia stellulata]|uniref:DUF2306 domain-containing protein n=1 Tax=Stappia stellulata TaxID=71235 RepID=UPI0004035425|nr:DUF2306 domain-containing protein [Stappia stellulata]
MTLAPLVNASPAIQLHAVAALISLALTPLQLAGGKGTAAHRLLGYGWVTAMGIVAVSSLWIHTMPVLGPFSGIHLLSVWVIAMLPVAVLSARKGQIRRHRNAMISFVIGALGIAGAFTLLPGRILHQVLFGL